jgi:hypothetical protein
MVQSVPLTTKCEKPQQIDMDPQIPSMAGQHGFNIRQREQLCPNISETVPKYVKECCISRRLPHSVNSSLLDEQPARDVPEVFYHKNRN